MHNILVALFGTYNPTAIVTPVFDSNGVLLRSVVTGYGLDVPYILEVLLFAIVLWSFLRIVGVFLNK